VVLLLPHLVRDTARGIFQIPLLHPQGMKHSPASGSEGFIRIPKTRGIHQDSSLSKRFSRIPKTRKEASAELRC
jgi:hypothetical protein